MTVWDQPFCPLSLREVVLIEMYYIYSFGDIGSILCREVVPFSEDPLLEVTLL